MAGGLVGSEILKIAAEVRALVASGRDVCNLTVGDFAPSEFRIPAELEEAIVAALRKGETNYPPSEGVPVLREAVRALYGRELGFTPDLANVMISSGSRPGIFATFAAVLDPGDKVLFPTPSWNNNHYAHLTGGEAVAVPCDVSTRFMPSRAALEPLVRDARLIALCSPQNPTGTMFTADQLRDICELVVEENERRGEGERPLYLMYDQVYWTLVFGKSRHVHPLAVCPEVAPYTVYVDGISKALAATGVRVGWVVAPPDLAKTISGILTHAGAWAPRAEQIAVASYLNDEAAVRRFRTALVGGVCERLDALYAGLSAMRDDGLPVEAIAPEGAIYLTVRFALAGRTTRDGSALRHDEDVRQYLLREAGMAIVPFQAFGVDGDSGWFRLSVGAVSLAQVTAMLPRVRDALTLG
ncbi:MAG: aminotransferase class I/II-fold pyridoxal phosphate-dependent enzyme [Gemmatimonadaceae bacterium]|nr:aminotransferase class I/II-fold pyridoxal phosphate-dependent enzyme [Gemmatimonadaceae bacterium]